MKKARVAKLFGLAATPGGGHTMQDTPSAPSGQSAAYYPPEHPGKLGTPAPCILCRRDTRDRGVFKPTDPEPFSSPLILYPVCDRHSPTQETLTAIEDVLLAREASRRN